MLKINLNTHGVIEAHAGTGKTWTIVNCLVLPILKGEGCPVTHIRDIMLVTYTEKAAGELKLRISDALKKLLYETRNAGNNPQLELHLEDCLNNLHEALIGTIHGVCLRLLESYPFETGMKLSVSFTEDINGLEWALRKTIREYWPQWGIDLSFITGGDKQMTASEVEKLILNIAKECIKPDTILCTESHAPGRNISTIIDDIKRRDRLNSTIVEAINSNIQFLYNLIENQKGIVDSDIEYVKSICDSWEQILGRGKIKSKNEVIGKGKSPQAMANKLKKRKIFNTQTSAYIEEACRAFERVTGSEEFNEWLQLNNTESELLEAIVVKTVPEVCRLWTEKKQINGLISFDDMLCLMHRAVHENTAFRHILRSRIRFAIIDEFQDTSVIQWDIFKRLFIDLDDDERNVLPPRLFIVGDPKQSIFSFQNAVVDAYLEACEYIKRKGKGCFYTLDKNYRSSKLLISACNKVFTEASDNDFFLSSKIVYSSENMVKEYSRQPEQTSPAGPAAMDEEVRRLLLRPFQIVPLHGKAQQRQLRYARHISYIIKMLHGVTFQIPSGDGWENRSLDYNDFAIIAENNRIADNMLLHLLEYGLPAAKYKQEGVFSSQMAYDFRALLEIIAVPEIAYSSIFKVLLSVFFNYAPWEIDSKDALYNLSRYFALFTKWRSFAAEKAWPKLFRSILNETSVRERLIRMIDGDRKICDLRQIMDFSLDYLIKNNGTLNELIQYLINCEKGIINTHHDENLHAKESDRKKVQIMTMHAAKGLEFPVCFVVTGSSRVLKGDYLRWTAPSGNRLRLHIMPEIAKDINESSEAFRNNKDYALKQQQQERRRLLYVALTRAKLFLFVPMHLDELKKIGGTWRECKLPDSGKDEDLTPILKRLADEINNNPLSATGIEISMPDSIGNKLISKPVELLREHLIPLDSKTEEAVKKAADETKKMLSELNLNNRRRYTPASYSMITHKTFENINITGRVEKEEVWEVDEDIGIDKTAPTSLLPLGKETGNALHEVIEMLLNEPEGVAEIGCSAMQESIIRKAKAICEANRLFIKESEDIDKRRIVEEVLRIAGLALHTKYTLPVIGGIRICDLSRTEYKTEAEFHFRNGNKMFLGYIDLLFRVRNGDGSYRYFIIDWKSNYLKDYGKTTLSNDIYAMQYDLQAKIYCTALDRFLRGFNGSSYDPNRHLGGALYVYLRGLNNETAEEPTWFYKPDIESDVKFLEQKTINCRMG